DVQGDPGRPRRDDGMRRGVGGRAALGARLRLGAHARRHARFGAPSVGVPPRPRLVHDSADRGAGGRRAPRVRDQPGAARGPAAVRDRLPALGLRLADPGAAARAAARPAAGDPVRERARALRSAEAAGGNRVMDRIDCDVHVAPESYRTLYPYLSDYWRDYVEEAGVRLNGLALAYPPGAPTSGGLPPSSYEELRRRVLEPAAPRYAVLNCLTAFETHRSAYFAAAVASAVNDWLREEFLSRDERLRASLVVSGLSTEDAVAEIERVGDDPGF